MTDKKIRIILDAKAAQATAIKTNYHVQNIGKSADKTQFSINKLAGAIAAIVSVQKIAQYADAWNRVQNQLVRTATSQENLAQTSQTLLELSNDTRSSLEGTVELYTSLSVATQSLNVSQDRIIGVTKTINNLFLESGKGAQESAGAIRQLGQALQSGALRGDEFNSVAEGAPGILRAIEQQTGKTRAELRELAAQGGITAELIVNSLENYSEAAQEAADKTSITLDQAFTVSGNNLTSFIGQLDDATGASAGLASAIIDLSSYISSTDFINGLLTALETTRLTFNATSDSVGDLSNELQLLGDVGGSGFRLFADSVKNALPNIRALIQIVTVELSGAIRKFGIDFDFVRNLLASPANLSSIKAVFADYQKELQNLESLRADSIADILAEKDAILETAAANSQLRIEEAKRRKEERDARQIAASQSATGSSFVAQTTSDTGQKEIAQAQNITKQLQNELNLRLQISDIYRQKTLADDASLYEQQLAAIQAREAEELARLQSKAIEEQIRRDEQFRQALESDKIKEEERKILREEQDAQRLLAEQILEQERTAILEQGVKARMELDKAERESRLANAGALGSALINLGQGQSKKIFKIGKTLALAQAAVALPTAVLESFKNGGGYPWGLIPATTMALNGAKQIQAIKSAGSGLGGGGGGSVSVPSLPGGGASGGPQIPTNTNSPELQQQRRIIELRGVSPGDMLTGEQVASIFESDDNVIVAFENARADAQRRNVTGITAR